MPNYTLEYQLSTSENVGVVQVINFTGKKEMLFDPHLTPREKMKIPKPYCTSTRDIPNHILEYHSSTL